MPSQRPYFLSSFIAAFRQQTPSSAAAAAASSQSNKHHNSQAAAATSNTASTSSPSAAVAASSRAYSSSPAAAVQASRGGGVPIPNAPQRRRGSDSSSEGFRDAIGADKWYIGGSTAGGEERFFKLGVVRRVKSNDGLSLDRLSL